MLYAWKSLFYVCIMAFWIIKIEGMIRFCFTIEIKKRHKKRVECNIYIQPLILIEVKIVALCAAAFYFLIAKMLFAFPLFLIPLCLDNSFSSNSIYLSLMKLFSSFILLNSSLSHSPSSSLFILLR